MWAVLKTHDVMEEYLVHNFEDHPSIAAENVRFLTYHMMGAGGNHSDVDARHLEKQAEKLETANKNLRLQLDRLSSRVEKLEKNRKCRHVPRGFVVCSSGEERFGPPGRCQ
jgi:hypothetical protein